MRVFRQRLTRMGWIGAVMFIAPLPISNFLFERAFYVDAAEARYRRTLEEVSGVAASNNVSTWPFLLLAVTSMVGFVMLVVGRETVEEG